MSSTTQPKDAHPSNPSETSAARYAAHTPGPWQASAGRGETLNILTADGRLQIATVYETQVHLNEPERIKADAALIAAAPETARERDQLRERNRKLEEELEACAWEISPGMYEAAIDNIQRELARTQAQRDALLAELGNIANANLRKWDEGYNTPQDFMAWAQNRARAAIAAASVETCDQRETP